MRGKTLAVAMVAVLCLFIASANGGGRREKPAEVGNLLPNSSFEEHKDGMPLGWSLSDREAEGSLEKEGRKSAHCISLIGKSDKFQWWETEKIPLEEGKTYRFSFYGKQSPGTSGGCVIGGMLNIAHRDYQLIEEWKQYSFVFFATELAKEAAARVGYWQRKGKMFFDDVSLVPVEPIHSTKDGITLGEFEKIEGSIYTFEPDFAYEGSNYSRPLFKTNCYFNTNRWVFGPGSYVIYKHEIKGIKQVDAKVMVNIGYHVMGDCLVEASTDGENWELIGKLSKVETKEFSLLEKFFPANEIYIRLRSLSKETNTLRPGRFQIYTYRYVSTLEKSPPFFIGRTNFLDIVKIAEDFEVEILSLGDLLPIPNRDNSIKIAIKSEKSQRINSEIKIIQGKKVSISRKTIMSTPQKKVFSLPYNIKDIGESQVFISLYSKGEKKYGVKKEFFVSPLYASDYGEIIKKDKGAIIWWCEGTYKVCRERAVPRKKAKYAKIYLAKGEYEPLQIVIYPKRDLKGVTAKIEGEFSKNWDIDYVYYHYVKHPTDYWGCKDWWPDALPHFTKPIDLKEGINQPLWLTFKAPEDIKAGEYKMTLTLKSEDGWEQKIPIIVHIFDFEIPKERNLGALFGLWESFISRYHNLKTMEERRRVWDLYLQNFREHRVSIGIYQLTPFDPIKVKFPDNPEDEVEIDFSAWSREVERCLTEYKFTHIPLTIEGMGYDRRYERDPTWRKGKIGKFEEGTVEHKIIFNKYLSKIEKFLEEKGWLEKTFVFWVDEPWPEIYPQVIEGMKKIKEAAPKLTRMLTEEHQPELIGHVDLWWPHFHVVDPSEIEKSHKKGERVWWYLCCVPRAPYPGLFIDHPAISLRIWLWMTVKYNIDGIHVWSTNWWTTKQAFPDPNNIQNPWEDPMTYAIPSGYWGNGDGRFLYPPNMDVNRDKRTYLEGPVNSIRWEILREGIEDYEYFWLLKDLIKKGEEKGIDTKEEEKLLLIPEEIIVDRTNFTQDPQLLYTHRLKIARAIEKLQKIVVKQSDTK